MKNFQSFYCRNSIIHFYLQNARADKALPPEEITELIVDY